MNVDNPFTDQVTQRIWDQFFSRVRRISRFLDDDVKRDLLLELQGHLFESFRAEEGQNESERLLNAIDRMGTPEVFLKPMLADRFITRAQRTMSLRTIVRGLYYNAYRSVSMAFASVLLGVGYLFVFGLVAVAIRTPIFPNNAGLLFFEDGCISAGFRVGDNPVSSDPLGLWTVPIGLALAALLYVGLTKFTRILRRRADV